LHHAKVDLSLGPEVVDDDMAIPGVGEVQGGKVQGALGQMERISVFLTSLISSSF